MLNLQTINNCLICENPFHLNIPVKTCFSCKNKYSHIEWVQYANNYNKQILITISTLFSNIWFWDTPNLLFPNKIDDQNNKSYYDINIKFFNSFLPYIKNNKEKSFFNIVSLLQ